ncbi:heavy metal translocating P-type ATPase [Verrucomicrobiales bacterium BCK34]|nr:heavy metal translocating P-type ATPase [Verrucomicrobiales bacterium BCK34]
MSEATIPMAPEIRDRKQEMIAALAIVAISTHLILRYAVEAGQPFAQIPLWITFLLGGVPLVYDLVKKAFRREFGSDLLAGISIVTSLILGEYLAGTLVILMLSGGEALEAYAIRGASSVLRALANRMPTLAHRQSANGSEIEDVEVNEIAVGDSILIYPHEICPVDGIVVEGHSVMDESYLTGEPYMVSKSPGTAVISGALNGESALTIRAEKRAVDSRYAKIMEVMKTSEQQRPRMRRLGDKLGAIYTPVALALAAIAWLVSGDPIRFLSVLVIATPCPLLIGIPVTIIGSISLAAKRAIIVRDPAILEAIDTCREVIFDKTGTLTYGRPELVDQFVSPDFDKDTVLSLTTSAEQYSKHPLSEAIQSAAKKNGNTIHEVEKISENPGEGLTATVMGKVVKITGRKKLRDNPHLYEQLPASEVGHLECVVLIDGEYAATYRFRDVPREDSALFVDHLAKRHGIENVMLLSGDRDTEAQYLAELVGIKDVEGDKSPEEKLAIVREKTAARNTIYVGDGINDAPALMAATVGIAFGKGSDVTAEAAGAVIMDSSLRKLDELLHIGKRMRRIALQSAVGGMALSIVGMLFAAAGYLSPVSGAILQEVIDVLAVLNALRAALPPKALTDY